MNRTGYIFFVFLFALSFLVGCTNDVVTTGPTPGDNRGQGSDTGSENSAPGTDVCIGDCPVDVPPVETCHPLIDENCPCRAGQMRLCSSYGDPQSFGPTSTCRPGVQSCVNGEWAEECIGEVGPGEGGCEEEEQGCAGYINEFGDCVEGPKGDPIDPNVLCQDGGLGVNSRCSCDLPEGLGPEHLRTGQVCYTGPIETLGVGICRAGLRDCLGDGTWGPCIGEQLPETEICGDGIDNNCNGVIDDGCGVCPPGVENCDDGLIELECPGGGEPNACGGCYEVASQEICETPFDDNCNGAVGEGCPCSDTARPCYPGDREKAGIGECSWGIQYCLGEFWGACEGYVLPTIELCGPDGTGNGLDNSCNGIIDDGCVCTEGETRACGSDVGECQSGTQTCRSNRWSTCEGAVGPVPEVCDGRDLNCNGVIDDGLYNACGTCGETCYVHDSNPTQSGTIGDGSEFIDANDPDNPTGRDGLTLSRQAFIPPYLWAANHTNDTVSKFNTDTGEEEGIYWVGRDPSRTAVDLDGNVWVVGRQDGRLTKVLWDNSQCQNTSRNVGGVVTQVNSAADPFADDCVVYSAVPDPTRPSIRGVATAPDGKVWFGYTAGGIQSIDPHTFQLGPYIPRTGAPRYAPDVNGVQRPVLDASGTHVTGDTGGVYGLVVDSRGYVYVSSFIRETLSRFNTNTGQWDALYTQFECGAYGIAIDKFDRVWTGGWPGCPGVGMFEPTQRRFYNFTVPASAGPTPGERAQVRMGAEPGSQCNLDATRNRFCVTGVVVEPATGDIWASFYPIGYNGRLRLNEADFAQSEWTFIATTRDANTNAYLPGVNPDLRGVGFDRNGYAWTLGLGSDRVWKLDPATNARAADLPLGRSIGIGSHYTYSDFTGSTVLSFTAPRSVWRYIFDTGFNLTQLDGIILEAYSPATTTVEVRVRALNSTGVAITGWIPAENQGVPQYMRYPVNVATHTFDLAAFGGPLSGSRFEVEVRLATTDPDVRPIVHDVQLLWQRP